MTDVIDYEFWSDFLFREGAICSPAELHGVMYGLHCAGNSEWRKAVLTVLDIPGNECSENLAEAISALHTLAGQALSDEQYGARLMLPDDALPLQERIRALSDWTYGFLFGLGNLGESAADRLDEQNRDALRDLAKMTELDDTAPTEQGSESDFTELVEYVRIVVISLYNQLRPKAPETKQIH